MFGPMHDLELLKSWDWDKVFADPSWEAEVLALHYFHNVLMCVTDQNGWTIDGCSLSPRGLNTLLVVKAIHDGIPLVAFCTEKFPIGCIRTFCRMYLEGRVKWHQDKFREI